MPKALFVATLAATAAMACAWTSPLRAADLDDDYVTRETIVEERPVVERERVIVRRHVVPRYDIDDDYDGYGPRIGFAAYPYWGDRWWGHRRHGWHHHRW